MKLKSQEAFFPVEIGDKALFFKRWTTKNEKRYLLAKMELKEDSNESDFMETIYESLLYNNCETPDEARKLSEAEKEYALVQLRKASIGDKFTAKFVCPKCNKKNNSDLLISKVISFKPASFSKIKETVGDEVIEIEFFDNNSLEARRIIREESNLVEKAIKEFCLSIKTLKIGEEVFESFGIEEVYEFVEELPVDVFDKLIDKFKDMKSSTSTNAMKVKCKHCKEEVTISLGDSQDFLPW